jgi:hypothetical protein
MYLNCESESLNAVPIEFRRNVRTLNQRRHQLFANSSVFGTYRLLANPLTDSIVKLYVRFDLTFPSMACLHSQANDASEVGSQISKIGRAGRLENAFNAPWSSRRKARKRKRLP